MVVATAETERKVRPFDEVSPHIEGIISTTEYIDRLEIEKTAHDLIHSRNVRSEVPVYRQERLDNARTALMEALTASGHLSRVEIKGKSIEDIHDQVVNRLLNGWSDDLPGHEKNRRFTEICEELIIHKTHLLVADGKLPWDTEMALISDYPEPLGENAIKLGYRPYNKKGMIRSSKLEQGPDGSFTRVIEQVSRSNGTWKSTHDFFTKANLPILEGTPDLVALQTPFLLDMNRYSGGVVDIVRLLDQSSGEGVLYGDVGDDKSGHLPYEHLRSESSLREQRIEFFVNKLANLEENLDQKVANKVLSFEDRTNIFKEEVDRILTAICTLEPQYTEDTFGAKFASHFRKAAIYEANGQHQRALAELHTADTHKQTVTFCGISISIGKAKEMGLEVNGVDELIEGGKDSWDWKDGVCVVDNCPTRPGKTQVGPCSVCKGCQNIFDHGGKPRYSLKGRKVDASGWLSGLLSSDKKEA